MDNVFETLNERGFIKQVTYAEQVANLLAEKQVTYYVGFDRQHRVCMSGALFR